MSRNSTLLLFKMKEERVWWCADENDLASCKTEGMELEQSGGCGISQKCTKLLRERDQDTRSTDEKRSVLSYYVREIRTHEALMKREAY